MIYSKFKGLELSSLGMGCMRLPCIEGENNKIDIEATKKMVAYAFEQGINYFDTAWGYHGGQSEPVMGEVLSEYPRESFYLASKFPGFNADLMSRVEEIFEKQLERCKTDYFDFYLFHCLSENNIDGYLDEKYGIFNYLMEQKKNGRIKHLGFSSHASLHTLKRFLDAYGKDLEFCQLQINWLDWDLQNAKEQVKLATSYGLPVWVMEPVRGGKLATLEPEYAEKLAAFRKDVSAPEWAFRFIQSLPEVVMTLSGMSNFEQLRENIKTFETFEPLSEAEKAVFADMARDTIAKATLPCTACKYCVDKCPMELDIPQLIKIYNDNVCEESIDSDALAEIAADKRPDTCIGCTSCEEVCPQKIRISDMMKEFAQKIDA